MANLESLDGPSAPDSASLAAECGEAWAAGGGARRVVGATAVGPFQVVHRAIVEQRSVTYRYEPAARGMTAEQRPAVDPWTLPFDVPEAEDSWSEDRSLEKLKTAVLCDCGDGTETYSIETPSVSGTGPTTRLETRTCSVCGGSARVFAIPEVRAALAERTESRVLEGEELPVDLLIEVGESFDDGERVYHEEGETIRPRSGGDGAYRAQTPRVSVEVSAIIDRLVSEAREGQGGETKIHRESVEVLQVPIFRLSLAGGRTAFLYRGKPWTAGSSQRGRRVLRKALVGTACLAIAVAVVAWALLTK